jgi:hypothetical protein
MASDKTERVQVFAVVRIGIRHVPTMPDHRSSHGKAMTGPSTCTSPVVLTCPSFPIGLRGKSVPLNWPTQLPGILEAVMSTEPVMPGSPSLELPVEELLRRARPLPPHEDMVIEDLDDEEGAAFLAVLEG